MQDGLEQAAPVEAIDDLTKEQLAYVAEVSKNARTTWFGLIGLLLFCGVTLLDVQDRDFFEYGASTQLPLINVSVPTANFFWAAPLLVTGLYTYLHLYLDKLWKALRPLGNDIGGKPVTQVVYPWLISDTALERREGVTRGPYWFVTRIVTLCLCWLIGPLVLGLFWIKSWAPHDEVLTTLIGLQLAWLCMVGVNSWLGMCRENDGDHSFYCRIARGWLIYCGGLLAYLIFAMGYSLTENGQLGGLYQAKLYRANFVKPDKDWKGRDAAWRDYRREHRANVIDDLSREKTDEADVTEQEIFARLKAEFEEDRGEARAALERRNYQGQDLRGANLREAMLVGLDLREARLEGADLREARLERANLSEARLEKADLREARLEGANLWEARLEGADLTDVRLEGANLLGVRLENAFLVGARLEKADLRVTNLDEALLIDARLEGAELTGASLKGTALADANLKGVNLSFAQLEGAKLIAARLDGAKLIGARLEGADFGMAEMTNAVVRYASVIGADLNNVSNLTQAQLDQMYGDHTTDLSGTGLTSPVHWPDTEIPFDQRLACWREWAIELGGREALFITVPETDVQCTIHND